MSDPRHTIIILSAWPPLTLVSLVVTSYIYVQALPLFPIHQLSISLRGLDGKENQVRGFLLEDRQTFLRSLLGEDSPILRPRRHGRHLLYPNRQDEQHRAP